MSAGPQDDLAHMHVPIGPVNKALANLDTAFEENGWVLDDGEVEIVEALIRVLKELNDKLVRV